MPSPPIDDEQLAWAVELKRLHGTTVAAAREAGVPRTTFQHWEKVAAERGMSGFAPVMPGFAVKTVSSRAADGAWVKQAKAPGDVFEVPEGHAVKGVSALVDADGRTVQKWIKTREEADPLDMADRIKSAFDGMIFTAPKIPVPDAVNAECLSVFPLPDLHMGLYVWGDEASENWDLRKADRVYRSAFGDLVAMTPRNGVAVILAGGDQMHADNAENRTARSANVLDVDGRYDRVLITTCELLVSFVCLTLQTHGRVIVRVLKGNHDPHASAAIAYFLLATFRDDPRVEVDVSPSLFWVHQFGSVMLTATHGHQAKPQQMAGIMAARWPKIWGDTTFRYAHTFHVHHKSKRVEEGGGAIVETHQSPAPQDAWHYGEGFTSGRSLRSIVYHQKFGEYGGSVRPIFPE